MSLSFLGKKSFHPSNPKNLQKLYAAEEKKKADEKKKAELEEQFKIDRDRAELRSLRRGGETLQDGEMGFMYQAPPGFQEAQARDQRRHARRRSRRSRRHARRRPHARLPERDSSPRPSAHAAA